MKKVYLALILLCLGCIATNTYAQTPVTYSYTGGVQYYTVPSGCGAVLVDARGAKGGNSPCSTPGAGGRVVCSLTVSPGQVLQVVVGGQGANYAYTINNGGYNGGGYGYYYGGGGGGGSDVRVSPYALADRRVVGGGGGGAGYHCCSDPGGNGGYPNGDNGQYCSYYWSYYCGAGGSQTGGGSGAGACGFSGSLGQGGSSNTCYDDGGGGGGGYYGGGGSSVGGGGGGSSYAGTGTSGVTYTNGFNSTGNGSVVITPLLPTVTTNISTLAFGSITSGTTSVPPMYFSMSGAIMTSSGTVTITPPSGVAISLDGITWSTSAIPYTYSGTSFSNVNVYARLTPSSGSYTGNIAITGGGLASAYNVAVTGNGTTACSGAPTAGSALSSVTVAGSATLINLSLSGASTSGSLYYQWQSSPNNTTWTDVNGAITKEYSQVGISANTYFRCVVSCASGGSNNSASVLVSGYSPGSIAGSSCTPNFSQTCSSFPMNTSIASLSGLTGTLADPSTSCSSNYMNQTSLATTTLAPGGVYTATLNISTTYYSSFATQIWIDFNNNTTFESSESVGGIASGGISSAAPTCTITIPSGAALGAHRMRIVGNYQCCGNTNYPSMNPCPTTSTSYGNVRDYTINIGPSSVPACSGTPVAGITASTPTSHCATFNPRLFAVGTSEDFSGLSYQWQSSTTGPTSGFSSISGATGKGYVATVSSLGVVYFRRNVTCASSTGTSTVTSDTLNPAPVTTGPDNVCSGANITLTNSVSGGVWTSSNTAQATVGSSTGIVTGVTSGTTPTITYTSPAGCIATKQITVNLQPAAIGGTFVVCPASTTTLTNATSGGTWSSSNTALASVGATTGVVLGVAGGNPIITYTAPTGCYSTAVLTVQALAPITGVPSMCMGYSTTLANATSGGVWSSSNTAVATISSTGVVTSVSVGTTTVSYTHASLGCTATIPVFVTNAPAAFTVTGGGARCIDDVLGVNVGVGSSSAGISYQLYNGATPVGSPITSAGFPFNFPPQFAAGTYGVVAASGTPCALTGVGTATIVVNPLPTPYTVSGGGAYCSGTSGTSVHLNSSQINVNYQLFVNTGSGATPVGGVIPGTSASLNFGLQTTAGTYTVGALNTITGCSGPMSNSVAVSINSLPLAYPMSGGGSFCTGGTGVLVGLTNSQVGVNYQLLLAGVPVAGAVLSGTGGALSYGLITIPGSYTIQATNTTTGCVAMMSTSATVSINSLPTVYTMTGGGAYCSGTTVGVGVGLNGSQVGVNYQLYRGTTSVGTAVAGTGGAISFPNQFTAGSYTVIATNPTTTCTSNMFGSAAVSINPLPTAFTIMAPSGNSYCVGGTGVNLVLSSSEVGVTYQLLNGATIVGAAAGTGSLIDFGFFTGAGTYTVVGTNTTTGCVGPMSGSINLVVNPLPTAQTVTVTGGGAYCAGGSGQTIGLTTSQSGVSYQLYLGGAPVTGTGAIVSGTGSAVNFGLRTIAGSYTVVGTTTATGCTNNMTGSAVISINPTPVVYTMTGGGGYCSGSTGTPIGLSGSDLGVTYQLFNSSTAVGAPISGIGSAISFGAITATGTAFNVVATNTATGCTKSMSGSLTVTVNPLPVAQTLTGGGNYCIGGTGVPVGLANSATGVDYQLYRGIIAIGSPVSGTTGSAISFGNQAVTGTYIVKATNTTTGCMNNMTGSAIVTTSPLPAVFTVTGGGNYCSGGTGVAVSLNGSVVGTNYQLYLGGATIGSPMAGTGGILNFGAQTAAGTYTVAALTTASTCANNMAGSANVTVNSLPTTYVVTGGGSYCAGGAGVSVGLSGSSTGVIYQLNIGGVPSGAPVAGTGGALSYGLQTANGTYTILATNTTTGCSVLMTGAASVAANTLPPSYTVTGGGNYCPGGTGSAVGLSGSNVANTYQLYRGATPVGAPVLGTGAAISFGLQTVTGNYTVVGSYPSSTCSGPMVGSATVGLNTLPTIYNVTGGGNYCPGGSGVVVGVNGSSLGVNYQLYLGGVITGTPIAGTGSALSFGLQTGVGTYTIKATNTSTGCSINMNGTAVVVVAPVPTAHTVTGGGNYCTGGTGLHIGLSSSTAGVYYQLYNGITAIGSPMAGTGASLDFGLKTMSGIYTITGTSTSTTCTNTMTGSVAINIDPLPTAYAVTGGGNYCSGGTGVSVMLSGSDVGTDYQLYHGAMAVGSPMPGTGAMLDFGLQTAGGTYTVVATNTTTTCNNNMTGSVTITVDPLPTAYNVTGGGNYCSGGTGVSVMLSGSDVGTQYQLKADGSPVGAPIAGTGFVLDFGMQTAPGNYTVSATNTITTCTTDMTGSANVGINALPTVYTVAGLGSSYCSGGTGINISLSGSDMGTNYQLYNGLSPVGGAVSGTGVPVNFGYLIPTGTYTVKAVNSTTGCTNSMSGAAPITINPLPVAFTTTGGGSYCADGTGVNIGLSSSNVGVSYQLYNGTATVGSAVIGTGASLNFGLQTAAGSYTIKATNTSTTCINTMAGAASVVVNPLPAAFTVTGGGNYCTGGTGVVVGLSGSAFGTNYQLYRGFVAVGSSITGTGLPINFGLQTTAGTYTVVATNASTSCSGNMAGSAVVAVNSLPAAHAVIGGGNYCPGGTGVNVGLGSSSTGISYQLYRGTTMVGAAVTGTGTSVDFGAQTMAGTYTVVATNPATGCQSNMSGSVNVGINSSPAVYNVVGGGNYCAGGAGTHIGLNNSTIGISYQAYLLASPVGSPVIGTGGPLDLGAKTATGSYTVIATDLATTCSSTMSGSASVSVSPVVAPAVTISTGVGDTVCNGVATTFTAMAVNGGSSPSYQWTVNGIMTGIGSSYSYTPANGDVVGVTLTSSAACAMPSTASITKAITVNVSGMPAVTVSANPGTNVCQGTIVNFTANPAFGGASPTYSWILNGINTSSSPVFSYTPADGDVVYCVMSSNYRCRTANSAASTHMTMNVDLPVLPVVTITANPGANIAAGQTLVLTASATNAGSTPAYQWFVNGVPVTGATTPTFASSNFVNGDSVSCAVTSTGGCGGVTGFNSLTVRVSGVGVQQIVSVASDIKLIPNPNKGTFTVKGTLATSTDEEVTMEVTNLLGQVIYNSKVTARNGELNERIELSQTLANGMYMLNLRTENENKVFHIVIER